MKKFLFSLLLLVLTSSVFAGTFDPSASRFTTFRTDKFIQVDFQDAVDTSATTNATITLLGSMQLIDNLDDQASVTVDYITTSNVEVGTMVWLLKSGAGSTPLSEDGNILLGGNAETVTSINIVKLIMTGENQFIVE